MLKTGEIYNLTYNLTDANLRYLAEMLAVALGRTPQEIEQYISEALTDEYLRCASHSLPYGRRLGWYAVVRARKPAVVVETGVAAGLGSLVLCAALLRNAAEGYPGRHYGTDINPRAGELLAGRYAEIGKIIVGDSIETLQGFTDKIDLFINDSDHSADYEHREYLTVENRLTEKAIILGDNSDVTDELAVFSRSRSRPFLFFREEPKDHWFPGGGIGISLPPRKSPR